MTPGAMCLVLRLAWPITFLAIQHLMPLSSVSDELFVIKTIENFTQACNSIKAGAWAPPPAFADHPFVSHFSTEDLISVKTQLASVFPV